ncbi:MAG: UDP-galactopyranose mutase [Clostridia bacterium]|nr:UDP-galactopyranose mutase [Clostridia bacterium]
MTYDYLIVGAGLFGATFANLATAKGKKCLVIERRATVGGNVYTENREGIEVHVYGAHIFHTSDEEVWSYVNKFASFNGYVNSPLANYHGEIYHLPFNMNTFREMWGVTTAEEAQAIIEAQVKEANIGEPENLEEQAIKMVGYDIYRKLVKEYTEKQWGRPCTQLPPFIIKRLPVRFTYDNNYFNDKYQGIPNSGYTAIIEKMLEGSDVMLGADFLKDKDKYRALAKRVVYTGAVDELFGYFLGKLEYRTLRFETETLDIKDYQGNAVINYTSHEQPYTRIIEHKHFVFGTQEKTIITKEYSKAWEEGDQPYYPVNDQRNNSLAAKYIAKAAEEGYILGGRLADYTYYNMDAVIKKAMELAEKII